MSFVGGSTVIGESDCYSECWLSRVGKCDGLEQVSATAINGPVIVFLVQNAVDHLIESRCLIDVPGYIRSIQVRRNYTVSHPLLIVWSSL